MLIRSQISYFDATPLRLLSIHFSLPFTRQDRPSYTRLLASIAIANDIHDFLTGVDEEVVFILLRRKATLRAFTWDMNSIQQK